MSREVFVSYYNYNNLQKFNRETWEHIDFSLFFVAQEFIKVCENLGDKARILPMPEIYKHKIALDALYKEFKKEEKILHVIFKPLSKVRFLEGAYNIVYYMFEGSTLPDSDFKGLVSNNYLRTLKKADEIWVGSNRSREFLMGQGLDSSKVFVVDVPVSSIDKQKKESLEEFLANREFFDLCNILKIPPERGTRLTFNVRIPFVYRFYHNFWRLEKFFGMFLAKGTLSIFKLFELFYNGLRFFNKILKRLLNGVLTQIPLNVVEVNSENIKIQKGRVRGNMVDVLVKNNSNKVYFFSGEFPLYIEYQVYENKDSDEPIFVERFKVMDELFLPGEEKNINVNLFLGYEFSREETYVIRFQALFEGFHFVKGKGVESSLTIGKFSKSYEKVYSCIFDPSEDEKYVFTILSAFMDFSNRHKDAVCLLNVVSSGKRFSKRRVVEDIRNILASFGYLNLDYNVFLVFDDFSKSSLSGLFTVSDYFVCPSLEEGYQSYIREAIGMGVVVITPRYDEFAEDKNLMFDSLNFPSQNLSWLESNKVFSRGFPSWESLIKSLDYSYSLDLKSYGKLQVMLRGILDKYNSGHNVAERLDKVFKN